MANKSKIKNKTFKILDTGSFIFHLLPKALTK